MVYFLGRISKSQMAQHGSFMINENLQQKDFTKPEYSNPVIDMSDFFIENPHFTLLRYEHVKGGIRVFYAVLN